MSDPSHHALQNSKRADESAAQASKHMLKRSGPPPGARPKPLLQLRSPQAKRKRGNFWKRALSALLTGTMIFQTAFPAGLKPSTAWAETLFVGDPSPNHQKADPVSARLVLPESVGIASDPADPALDVGSHIAPGLNVTDVPSVDGVFYLGSGAQATLDFNLGNLRELLKGGYIAGSSAHDAFVLTAELPYLKPKLDDNGKRVTDESGTETFEETTDEAAWRDAGGTARLAIYADKVPAGWAFYQRINNDSYQPLLDDDLKQGVSGHLVMRWVGHIEGTISKAIRANSRFNPPTPYKTTRQELGDVLGVGCKMGEGWLLTAERCELIDSGVKNIVCVQPFGCLPNHIAGKGTIRALREKYPGANIVPIDYDPGATRVNQENRLKLMLSVAREQA